MKIILITVAGLIVLGAGVSLLFLRSLGGVTEAVAAEDAPSFYDLKIESLAGETVDMAQYKGQVALVVNVASECGFTGQYKGLEALYRELAPRGFVVLGFPSNDFRGQEPGTAEEIRTFCSTKFDVTFPMFAKVKVKGPEKCEAYRLLTAVSEEPDWNFTKYLVDGEGKVRYRFGPPTKPDDKILRAKIEALLPAGAK